MTTIAQVRFKHLKGLSPGDRLHLVMYGDCAERDIAGILPDGAYLLSNGGTITESLEPNYHLPDECPLRHRREPDVAPGRREEFEVPSESQPGVTYAVEVTTSGHLICNCGAGSSGRWCKHKEHVKGLLHDRQAEGAEGPRVGGPSALLQQRGTGHDEHVPGGTPVGPEDP